MRNLKHTIAAFLAVVLIGSLAVSQASDITAANADKIEGEYLTVSDAQDADISDVVYIEGEAQEKVELSDEEKQEALGNVRLVDIGEDKIGYKDTVIEEARPFEPITGYVITTTGGLNVRAGEGLDTQILDSIIYGQMIDIIDETDEWYVIPFGEDGGVGYVLKEYVTTSYEEAREILLESVMYESGVVSVEGGSLNVRSAAGTENTMIIDQVADGDYIVVLDRVNDEWMKVYYGNNYNVGYVMSKYVSIAGMVARDEVSKKRIERIEAISDDGIIVSNSTINVRKMPSEDAAVINTMSNGTKCLIISKGSQWTKIAYGAYRTTGYVKSEYIMTQDAYDDMIAERNAAVQRTAAAKKTKTSTTTKKVQSNANPAPSSKGQAIVNEAAKYIGVRYVYGGTSPSGFDCSGLVQYVCRKVGISVNRTSRSQYSNGVAVSKSNLQAGDLVFFSKGSGISHVGIYAGNGQVIHAPSPGKKVCYIALSKICSYSTFVGARRVY